MQADEEQKPEKDINDIFDDILLSEENLHKEGYDEGYQQGSSDGNTEAYHLGYHRGAEIGAELAYYSTIIEHHIQHNPAFPKSEKTLKNCQALLDSIQLFPAHNSETVDLIQVADDIRMGYKKCCALLKIDAAFPESDKLSF